MYSLFILQFTDSAKISKLKDETTKVHSVHPGSHPLSLLDWKELLPSWLESLSGWLEFLPGWLEFLPGWLETLPVWLESLSGWLESLPSWQESLPGNITIFFWTLHSQP